MPISAIDTHAHVLMKDLPMITERHAPLLGDYPVERLLAELENHQVTHALVTAPSIYETDNSMLLAALQAAPGRLRGTVILAPDESIERMQELSALGVCGFRLNWWRKQQLPDIKKYRSLLSKAREVGWHLELFLDGVHMPAVLPTIRESGVNLVLDHFGCPEPIEGVNSPGFRMMLDSIAGGSTWVKLSAPYRLSGGNAQAYARVLLNSAGPERLMWGSDWPWGGFESGMSYQRCLDWLTQWVPDSEQRKKILVDTPARLFGFFH